MYFLGFVMSATIFGIIVKLIPSLQTLWGLLLFVPFSLVFSVSWAWLLYTHPNEISKNLGESKEEQRRKLYAILGRPNQRDS